MAIGAASGVAAMIVSVAMLTLLLPAPTTLSDTIPERLAYALGANVFAILPFLIMLMTVGNSRFFSDAIDPTQHAETQSQEVDGRVADNTLQQNFIFLVATLALSTVVPYNYLQVIGACAIVFVIARSAFWFGYRLHPLYRAPGMSSTAYMNLFIILYVLYQLAS